MDNNINIMGTPQEQLAIVNEAIYAVLKGGQSYKIGSRQLERADLERLIDMQMRLQSEVAKDTNRCSPLLADTVVAVFDGR